MKRLLCLAAFVALAASGFSQGNQTEPSTFMERAYAASIAVAKNLWTKLEEQGRPLAEKLLKAAPTYYRESQKSLEDFAKKIDKADLPKTFQEKQQLALELWKLRGAVNVMALSNPETVKLLLNVQPQSVQKMQKDLSQVETKLKKANLPGI